MATKTSSFASYHGSGGGACSREAARDSSPRRRHQVQDDGGHRVHGNGEEGKAFGETGTKARSSKAGRCDALWRSGGLAERGEETGSRQTR